MTSEPLGDIVMPVMVLSTSKEEEEGGEHDEAQSTVVQDERKTVNHGPKLKKLQRNTVIFEEVGGLVLESLYSENFYGF